MATQPTKSEKKNLPVARCNDSGWRVRAERYPAREVGGGTEGVPEREPNEAGETEMGGSRGSVDVIPFYHERD